MKYIPRPLIHSLVLLLTIPTGFAQDGRATLGITTASPLEKRIDVKFENQTAKEVVSELSRALNHPINVMFPGQSANAKLPSMRLQQVTLQEIFFAIASAGEVDRTQGRPGYQFQMVDGAPEIYTLVTLPPHAAEQAARTAETSSVFVDLSPVLDEQLDIEDVTTAIRTAWAASGGDEPPAAALKYHQETRLLIATGPPKHLNDAAQIVELLRNRLRPSNDAQEQHIRSLDNQLNQRQNQIDQLERRMAFQEQERDNLNRTLLARITELEMLLAKKAGSN